MLESDSSPRPGNSGAILLLLLGIIFACTLMVAAFVQSSMSEIRWAGQDRQASQLRPHAYSALDVTLASMSEYALLDEPMHAPLAEWQGAVQSEGIEFPGGLEIEVEIRDIGDRIGVTTLASREDWIAYFDAFEYRGFDRDSLIDALLDWMDADSTARPFGAEAEDYRIRGLPIMPTDGPPMTIDELQDVMGFAEIWWEAPDRPSALARTLQSTLSSIHSMPPNVNTADLAVLRYLTGDDFMARDLYAFRIGNDEQPGTEDDNYFKNQEDLERNGFSLERPAAYVGDLYAIEIQINSGGGRFHLSTLVSKDATNAEETENKGAFTIIRSSEYYRFSSNREL